MKMKKIKKFLNWKNSNKETFKILTPEERIKMFGEQTKLEKEFSDIMFKHLIEDNTTEWATYNAVLIELKKFDKNYSLEIEYMITDGRNPKKVFLHVLDKINNKSSELIRLYNKIKDFNF